jgi:hypothetical protein
VRRSLETGFRKLSTVASPQHVARAFAPCEAGPVERHGFKPQSDDAANHISGFGNAYCLRRPSQKLSSLIVSVARTERRLIYRSQQGRSRNCESKRGAATIDRAGGERSARRVVNHLSRIRRFRGIESSVSVWNAHFGADRSAASAKTCASPATEVRTSDPITGRSRGDLRSVTRRRRAAGPPPIPFEA